jgi:hypothetical protein
MKKNCVVSLSLLLGLTACVPYMYGVPKDSWDRMSEPERMEAMRIHERTAQADRQAAEERARIRAIEEQKRRRDAEDRARHEVRERELAQTRQAALERERHEHAEAVHLGEGPPGTTIRERGHQPTALFVNGRTLKWETDAQGGQYGTIRVTSTSGTYFYLEQKNRNNTAAGVVVLEGQIKDGKVIINNRKWNETWVGTIHNGVVTGKINNKYTFRISE